MKDLIKNSPLMHSGKWTSKEECFYQIHSEIAKLNIESILNIGIGPNLESARWNKFLAQIHPVEYFENLEITSGSCDKARKSGHPVLANVTHGDVRNIADIYPPNQFDLIFWNQGPEHIYREEWADIFKSLKEIAAKAIYIHVPWGSGYDYDKYHYAKSIKKGEFEKYGFSCKYHGKENTKDAGVMGYLTL